MSKANEPQVPVWAMIAVGAFIVGGTWYASQDTVCKPLADESRDYSVREMTGDYLTPAERTTADRNGWWLATYCRDEYVEASKPSALDALVQRAGRQQDD